MPSLSCTEWFRRRRAMHGLQNVLQDRRITLLLLKKVFKTVYQRQCNPDIKALINKLQHFVEKFGFFLRNSRPFRSHTLSIECYSPPITTSSFMIILRSFYALKWQVTRHNLIWMDTLKFFISHLYVYSKWRSGGQFGQKKPLKLISLKMKTA